MLQYFLILIVLTKFDIVYGFNENRIYNGEITPPGLFPFAFKLHTLSGSCSASVISKRHVLTAAHCIWENESTIIQYDRYKVYLDIPYFADVHPTPGVRSDRSTLQNSTKVYLPKTYSWPTWPLYDIAVIEFPDGTDFDIEPVKLAKDYYEKEGDEAYIMGYGPWTLENKKSTVDPDGLALYHAKVTMINDCSGTLLICGGNATHRALPGDSGGPMVINRNNQWYQIGVSAHTNNYDGRSRVASYCNFIEEVTKNEVKCESIFPERNNINFPIKIFEPIYKGQSTPIKLFNFVVPLYNYYYNQGCTATVISKRHLLTSGFCVYRDWWAESKMIQFTEHSTYKTVIGKLFPDFRTKNIVHSNFKNEPINVTAYFPLKYVWPWQHNIAVIEYPKGTDFGIEPVTLAKDHFPIYLDNSTFILAGFGFGLRDIKNNVQHTEESPPILLHDFALPVTQFNKRVKNENLAQAEGASMLYEKNGKFYQIGVNYHSGTPNGKFVLLFIVITF
uniref:Peptidase S1 domain-containing protein n=1 Tax=Panagrolaimus davidi TaxID=227884 RepID=A0A914QP99_9BILA